MHNTEPLKIMDLAKKYNVCVWHFPSYKAFTPLEKKNNQRIGFEVSKNNLYTTF